MRFRIQMQPQSAERISIGVQFLRRQVACCYSGVQDELDGQL